MWGSKGKKGDPSTQCEGHPEDYCHWCGFAARLKTSGPCPGAATSDPPLGLEHPNLSQHLQTSVAKLPISHNFCLEQSCLPSSVPISAIKPSARGSCFRQIQRSSALASSSTGIAQSILTPPLPPSCPSRFETAFPVIERLPTNSIFRKYFDIFFTIVTEWRFQSFPRPTSPLFLIATSRARSHGFYGRFCGLQHGPASRSVYHSHLSRRRSKWCRVR